jgi:hypothetical protein
MSLPNVLPFPVGTATTKVDAALVGQKFESAGKLYRLVKVVHAIGTCSKLVCSHVMSAGVPTWTVELAGTNSTTLNQIAGVIPVGQTGSDGSAGLLAGDYFLVQIGGVASVVTASSVAIDDGLAAVSTAGKVDNSTTAVAVFGQVTAAATAANSSVSVLITKAL